MSDTLSCWADQDLGAQATEFRPFKNANILTNNPEIFLAWEGGIFGERSPQKQNISRVGFPLGKEKNK